MPAVQFFIRWPDGKEDKCYSPSTVIREYFKPGDKMPLSEFVQRSEAGLTNASERVAARYGYFCSSASDQLQLIRQQAESFDDKDRLVAIMSMRELTG